MAKKSKQRSSRQKKDQSGCMWGLMSMFDFRHGRNTRRLLSDRRRQPMNNAHDSLYTLDGNLLTNSPEMHPNIEDVQKVKKPTMDLVRARVKELIEEEMFIDQDPKFIKRDHEQMNSSKTLKESFDQEISNSHQVSAQKTTQYHDLEALVKEILFIYQKKNGQHDDLDRGAKRYFPIVEEKLIAAVEVLLNEKSTNGDFKHIHHSKEMFQMLSSNKEIFLKILQEQNSILLNEDQKSKLLTRSNSLEMKTIDQEQEELVTRKHRKFFRRRSKSQDSISMNGKDRIVILKPGSSENQVSTGNGNHSVGHGSQFSFVEIKRRLKHAMGKEQQTPRPIERTGKSVVDGGWSSPSRDHFYTERFARVTNGFKTGDRVSSLRESEQKNENANHRVSSIYVEAKKHLSEMLTSGDEDAELMMRSLPKSLGRILSLREYNSLSPGTSPRAQTRPLVNKTQALTTIENPEGKVVDPDDMTSDGAQEILKSPLSDKEYKEQSVDFDVSCESNGSPNGIHDVVIIDGSNEDWSSEILKHDLPDENGPSSSQTHTESSLICKTEELVISSGERTGKPSPVSILEPLFSDDDISPARTATRPVEAGVQPLCIQFDEASSPVEDQQIRITDSGDTEESAFEYVEAVLLSSDLNWSEFEKRWISSVQILDPSLFDEVESFSSRARYDQKLLFNSTNEVLEEVCSRFIPESSFIKQNVWPVPKGMDLINEVWSRLESCLYKLYPRDLEKLVRNDMETSRMWMNLQSASREIVIEIEESIFRETIDDTLFSLLEAGTDYTLCLVRENPTDHSIGVSEDGFFD
uniref:uncharacterized protein LOC122593452 n=1 Tax=Erigeron canadensis TaxID=72917 RepID=UPI001CB98F6F|nr:uncharacterized protein LOC122593452 [Erigeron canadensis]XP_043621801.1 uncharacterized protein LOC122593452 [Erigeron canadensis]